MFTVIQPHEYRDNRSILNQMFRLRKRVFFDKLGWDVTVSGEFERDAYDDIDPVYLIWTDTSRSRLYGCIRLLPTTGPTLLRDVFHDTFPDAAALLSPSIWEGTRMCIDEDLLSADLPEISPNRALALLLLGLCECALHHGIRTLISNYEPHMQRIYRQAGAEFEELGRSSAHGRRPVCCAAFEVSDRVLSKMQAVLKNHTPLYSPGHWLEPSNNRSKPIYSPLHQSRANLPT